MIHNPLCIKHGGFRMRHLTSTILTAALVLLLSVSLVSCASGSSLNGAFKDDESNAGNGGSGYYSTSASFADAGSID